MKKNMLKDITARLRRKRADLLGNLTGNRPQLNEGGGKESSEFEEAVQYERIESISDSLSRRERLALEEIDAALERISEGDYGNCATCGSEINPARLVALPATELCIECASDLERESRKESSGGAASDASY